MRYVENLFEKGSNYGSVHPLLMSVKQNTRNLKFCTLALSLSEYIHARFCIEHLYGFFEPSIYTHFLENKEATANHTKATTTAATATTTTSTSTRQQTNGNRQENLPTLKKAKYSQQKNMLIGVSDSLAVNGTSFVPKHLQPGFGRI